MRRIRQLFLRGWSAGDEECETLNRTFACEWCEARDWRLVFVAGQPLGVCRACGRVLKLRRQA